MIAILQPHIPHYREAFFKGIKHYLEIDIFCFESAEQTKKNNFKDSGVNVEYIYSCSIKSLLYYNPIKLLDSKYTTIVLMLSITHLTTWMILLLNKFWFRKRIILWGHGISINNYEEESKKPNTLRKLMIKLADEVWFYTESEKEIWEKEILSLKSISLNNTIEKVDITLQKSQIKDSKSIFKQKYSIKTPFVLIYCARFNEIGRRADLLNEIISKTDSSKFTYIIIGNGKYKPNFSKFNNVLDFGDLYDEDKKNELFLCADLYIQPGWLGLSVVEAMASGLGIFSFKRTKVIPQCVEYSYVMDGYNGKLVESVKEAVDFLENVTSSELNIIGENAKQYSHKNLRMTDMINRAIRSLQR